MPSDHFILCRFLLLLASIFPSIRVFSSESALHTRWPKYWSFSFSISPFNEYSGLISFRIDLFDLLAVQKSSLAPQFRDINSSALCLLYCPAFTCAHDYWKNQSYDSKDLCRQSNKVLLVTFHPFWGSCPGLWCLALLRVLLVGPGMSPM